MPGVADVTSSRLSILLLNSSDFRNAHGDSNRLSSAIKPTTGTAYHNTGRIQRVSPMPEQNHTTISLSR